MNSSHRRRSVDAPRAALLLVACLAAVAVLALRCANVRTAREGAAGRHSGVPAGVVQVLALAAPDSAGGRRRVWVYRPGVPDSSTLPVVYFLHGLPGSYQDLQHLGVAAMLDRAFGSRALPPFVLVCPDGNSTGAADPEWADSVDGTVRLETFVTTTLVSAVEGLHRRPRADRAILGFSMGGYGAMNIALRHPDLYGAVASVAGYFDTDDESGVFAGRSDTKAANAPARHPARSVGMRVMLSVGRDDATPVVAGQAQQFAARLRAVGTQPVVDIRPGGHDLAFLRSELPRVFGFLAQPWRRAA